MPRISIYEEWIRDGEIENKLLLVSAWARDGLSQEQIAENLGISAPTLIDFKKKYIEFFNALKNNKDIADIEVENSLNKSAQGYDIVEDVPFKLKRVFYEDGKRVEEEYVEVVKIKKHMPAQVMAQIYWLNNRKPIEWRQNRKDADADKEILDKLDKILEVQADA